MTPPILILRDAKPGRFDIRWRFDLRHPLGEESVPLAVRTSRSGVLVDVQQLGSLADAVEYPPEVTEAISVRVFEELARVKLAASLRDERETRWAA